MRWTGQSRAAFARQYLTDSFYRYHNFSVIVAQPLSFTEPDDIDAAILLPPDFQHQIEQIIEAALELEEMILTRRPEEIVAVEDESDWNEWIECFSRTREADGRRKGLVEVKL